MSKEPDATGINDSAKKKALVREIFDEVFHSYHKRIDYLTKSHGELEKKLIKMSEILFHQEKLHRDAQEWRFAVMNILELVQKQQRRVIQDISDKEKK